MAAAARETGVGPMAAVAGAIAEAVGKDLVLIGPGHCGKRGQLVPVDDGGPHIRVKDVIVGGLQ